jgi:hypothetical protein
MFCVFPTGIMDAEVTNKHLLVCPGEGRSFRRPRPGAAGGPDRNAAARFFSALKAWDGAAAERPQ